MATETVPATTEVAYNTGTEEPGDQLNRLSAQLEALLCTMTGDGFQNFAAHSKAVQENMLWLAHSLAHQITIVSDRVLNVREVAHG